MFIFQILAYLSLSKRNHIKTFQQRSSFSFSNGNKQITLHKPIKLINNVEKDQNNWYYVHFLIKNLSDVPRSVQIDSTDMIIKNTFLLYLSYEQLTLISDISLIKKLDSSDKITEESESLEKSKYLLVFGPKNFILDQNSNDYNIESKHSSSSYLISFKDNSMQTKRYLLHNLAENPIIKSIVPYNKPILRNNLMTGFTQKNTFKYSKDEKSGILYINKYLNEKGIDGRGEIVTVIDSPLDFHHSMFYDENDTFDINRPLLNHRKIIYYNYYSTIEKLEKEITDGEHGTHVAGTIAGESMCYSKSEGFELFNGIAPKSKLIFFPLLLFFLDDEIKTMNDLKSRISSNSWDSMGFSDSENFLYGDASYKNPQILFIFAAGNEYDDGNFSVADPSGSKNILSVGAIDDLLETKHKSRFQSIDDPSVSFDAEQLYMPNPFFGGEIGTDIKKSDIFVFDAEQTNSCSIFNEEVMFLAYATSRSKMNWIDKCKFYVTKGAHLSTDIEKVKLLLKSSFVNVFDITPVNETKPLQHSSYSSAGPGNKGVMKPDLLGPGTRIASANSVEESHSFHGCRENGTSEVTFMEGTSQATPNIAGAAALVRQYFEFGNWSYNVDLDSTTMRALLINSCVHPLGSKTIDVLYGHGVVDLSTILPFDGEFGVQITKQFSDKNHPSISEYGHKIANLTVVSNEKKLQITLSYLDQMLDKNSPIVLKRDIDLVVVSPSGKLYKGDHIKNGETQHLSTNEKVIIEKNEIEIGQYSIHVLSGAFVDSGINENNQQNFSVVVSGNIENGYLQFSDSKSCIGCNSCDENHPLHCNCNESSIGSICQAKVYIEKDESFSIKLDPHEIRRIRIKEKNFFYKMNYIKNVEIESLNFDDDKNYQNVWIDKNCHLELGEFENYLGNFRVNSTLRIDIDDYKSSQICIAVFNNDFKESSFKVIITNKNNMIYFYIGVGIFAAFVIAIVIVVVVLKTSRKQKLKGNGFTEIKSLN